MPMPFESCARFDPLKIGSALEGACSGDAGPISGFDPLKIGSALEADEREEV